MKNDTMKEIINDVKDLASTRKNPLTRLALEGIANRLEQLVERGLYITPKAALDVAKAEQPVVDGPSLNEVFKKGLDIPPVPPVPPTKNRGQVGIRFNDTSIVAWNLADNKNIRVTGRKINDHCWQADGYVADTLRISAAVFGGKHATLRYVKFIRNGLMSRVMRRKHVVAAKEVA